MNKKDCRHVQVAISSKIPYNNHSYFIGGEFKYNDLTDWDLDDRTNIHVECLECHRAWQGSHVEEFPEWIQTLLEEERKRFR